MLGQPLLETVSPWIRTWLSRLLVSIVIGICLGLLVFIVARGVAGIVLFVQQQDALQDVVGVLGGGFDQPPPGDLRAMRRYIETLDRLYWRISVLLGLAAAVPSAIAVYVWLERYTAKLTRPQSG